MSGRPVELSLSDKLKLWKLKNQRRKLDTIGTSFKSGNHRVPVFEEDKETAVEMPRHQLQEKDEDTTTAVGLVAPRPLSPREKEIESEDPQSDKETEMREDGEGDTEQLSCAMKVLLFNQTKRHRLFPYVNTGDRVIYYEILVFYLKKEYRESVSKSLVSKYIRQLKITPFAKDPNSTTVVNIVPPLCGFPPSIVRSTTTAEPKKVVRLNKEVTSTLLRLVNEEHPQYCSYSMTEKKAVNFGLEFFVKNVLNLRLAESSVTRMMCRYRTKMAPRSELEARLGNQSNLLRYWDELTTQQQNALRKQVERIDNEECSLAFSSSAHVYTPNPENLHPIPKERHAVVDNMTKEEKDRLIKLGLEAVSRNEVCALVLAGGQASRLGSSAPKGTIPLGMNVAKGDSLLAIQAAKLARLEELSRESFPGTTGRIEWLVMTSMTTEEPTRKHLEEVVEENGLKMDQVSIFRQDNIPAFDMEGNLLLSEKGVICTAPNGNGGLYSALSPLLPSLKQKGIKYIHVYCVDNILCKVADPVFIGLAVDKNADCLAKTVLKSPGELIGSITLDGDKPRVTEYSELGPELASRVGPDGRLLFCAGSIANHLFTVEFLESFCTLSYHLSYHRALKKIPHINEKDELIKPTEPNGIKLEQFVFDVFPMSKNFHILEVPRETEFSPLKNAESVGKDCLSTCKRDYSSVSASWLRSVGATVPEDKDVFVSARLSYFGEGLEKMAGVQITDTVVE